MIDQSDSISNFFDFRIEQVLNKNHKFILFVEFYKINSKRIMLTPEALSKKNLNKVSKKLTELSYFTEEDIVTRINSNRFIIISSWKTPKKIQAIASSIIAKLVSGDLCVSIGIDKVRGCLEKSIYNSATAMFKSRHKKGINEFLFYKKDDFFIKNKFDYLEVKHLEIAEKLRSAVDNDELYLEYQPQIDTRTGKIFGVEALVRWKMKDEQRIIPPGIFIPLAEESGLIKEIGEWVLKKACIEAFKHYKDGHFFIISVNISGDQLSDPNFLTIVLKSLELSGLPAEFLLLEVTETALIKGYNLVVAKQTLKTLRSFGVKISIDDFGSGYSSFNYINNFTVDQIKIDKIFVDEIVTSAKAWAIICSIVSLADNLGIECVAEGVESYEQAALLEKIGCFKMQGFLFYKPDRYLKLEAE